MIFNPTGWLCIVQIYTGDWLILISFRVPDQATKFVTGAIAGATLMPMVMNAQNTAANTDAI